MSYILTYKGIHFDPMDFNPKDIHLEDIAHSLSLLCRANGHMIHFYSVLQHSLNCAYEAIRRKDSKIIILGCLLHDGSEAYLSDVVRPLKKDMREYLKIEQQVQDAIFDKFVGPLTIEERKEIFSIDDSMLAYEFKHLMKEGIDDSYEELKSTPELSFIDPTLIEEEFLWLYYKIFGGEEKC